MPNLRDERGILDHITWFIIVTAMLVVGGISLIFGVPSDPPSQESIVVDETAPNTMTDPQGPHNQGAQP